MTNPTPTDELSRAASLAASGDAAGAEASYRRIIEGDPTVAAAYHGLALLAFGVGKLEVAAQLLTSATALEPQVALYRRDLGEIWRRLGRLDEAIAAGGAATQLAPADAEAHYNLGLAFADRGDYTAAVREYERAIELNPGHGHAFNNLGAMLERLGHRDAAAEHYRAAIEKDPRNVEAWNNLGTLLGQNGDVDGAKASYEEALRIAPDSVLAHYNVSALKRYSPDDPSVVLVESLAAKAAALPIADRVRVLFTLGKVRDDLGDYDRAFAAYAEGNRLHATTLRFDESRMVAQTDSLIRCFDAAALAERAGAGHDDATPVFIVGMPRSGTTLTEQILASHPRVHGAGELKDLHRAILQTARVTDGVPLARALMEMPREAWALLAQRYIASIRGLSASAARITDKMPANFHYLGAIRLAMPNARIIHVVRDPMDSCLSCYTHLFNDTMEFAYDLRALGRYYVRYMKLMEHWRRVLPADFVLDVRYEDLVADVEHQARRMLAFVGLEWDDNCLRFYNNARPVRTASLAQVRRPIYGSSVQGWRRFAAHLAPLLEIVGDYR